MSQIFFSSQVFMPTLDAFKYLYFGLTFAPFFYEAELINNCVIINLDYTFNVSSDCAFAGETFF